MKQMVTKGEQICTEYFCDDCKERTPYEVKCAVCKKDICYRCWGFYFQYGTDSPPKHCKTCFDIGNSRRYFDLIISIKENAEESIKSIMQNWQGESIEQQDSHNNSSIQ